MAYIFEESNLVKIEKRLLDKAPEFLDLVKSMTRENMDKEILKIVKYGEEVKNAKANDPDIKELEEQLKDAKAPYNNALNVIKDKVSFIFNYMALKGYDA